MKKVFLLLPCLLCLVAGYGQLIPNVSVTIVDKLGENGRSDCCSFLTSEQFRGIPERESQFAAMLYTGIKVRYCYKVRKGIASATILISAYVDEGKSWYKTSLTPELLAHEQKHFEIATLVAAQFAREAESTRFFIQNFSQAIDSMHDRYMLHLAELQQQYDRETDHGMNEENQKMWSDRLTHALQSNVSIP